MGKKLFLNLKSVDIRPEPTCCHLPTREDHHLLTREGCSTWCGIGHRVEETALRRRPRLPPASVRRRSSRAMARTYVARLHPPLSTSTRHGFTLGRCQRGALLHYFPTHTCNGCPSLVRDSLSGWAPVDRFGYSFLRVCVHS